MIDIFHFHNGKKGGVYSVIKNLLQFSASKFINNHIIFTINEDDKNDFEYEKLEAAATQQIFNYNSKNNFYYTCKELAKLVPNKDSIIVAHDWLELGMASNLGLQNKVVSFLHGDYEYYYDLAIKHSHIIDLFIPVSQSINDKLLALLPERKESINYLRFPVPAVISEDRVDCHFNISFVGRMTTEKGYDILPLIAEKLAIQNKNFYWHIFGAQSKEPINYYWSESVNVKHYGEVSQKTIINLLPKMHLILLPSKAEGMPVSVIEAMKAGVVPLVSNINGGIQEIVKEGITGYKLQIGDVASYVERILYLSDDKMKLKSLKKNCISVANEMFDAILNTKLIENALDNLSNSKGKDKTAKKIYGSRLDNTYFPNYFVRIVRYFI